MFLVRTMSRVGLRSGGYLFANQSERLSLSTPRFRGSNGLSQENEPPVRTHISPESDDLSREVYGVLGIPIDAVDLAGCG